MNSSSDTVISSGSADNDNNGNETSAVVVSSTPKKLESFLQRLILQLDEFVIVKLMMRVWGARLEFIVRLMLLATFFDDTFRTVGQFTQQSRQISNNLGVWLPAVSNDLVSVIATVVLGLGLIVQWLGSLGVLALIHPDASTKSLILWTILQPILYAQLSNVEYIFQSLSLVGGLLILRSQIVFFNNKNNNTTSRTGRDGAARSHLLGRLLLPAAYLYDAKYFFSYAFTLVETQNLAAYVVSLVAFVLNVISLLGLVLGSVLVVAAGIKSRTIPLLLAIVNLGFVCHQHLSFGSTPTMPHVALSKDVPPGDIELWQIYDLHQYYFFLGLSTSGALLLLGQFGLRETKGV